MHNTNVMQRGDKINRENASHNNTRISESLTLILSNPILTAIWLLEPGLYFTQQMLAFISMLNALAS